MSTVDLKVFGSAKCEHGVRINAGQCLKCFPDQSWAWEKITQEEFDSLWRSFVTGSYWGSGPWRHSPYPMQYISQPLVRVALMELAQARGFNIPKAKGN